MVGPGRVGLFQLLLLCTGVFQKASAAVCGSQLAMNRIVGGENAINGRWPWQASVQVDRSHVCGGTVISHNWVLSAAHCYYNKGNPVSSYRVCLGMYQLLGSNPNSVCVGVQTIIANNNYTHDGSPGDILLLELQRPAPITDYIFPVCLPNDTNIFPAGLNCMVTGWGNVDDLNSLPAPMTLQEVTVPLIDWTTCDELYHVQSGVPATWRIIQNNMICAGYATGGKDSCQGDSGGPLVCDMDGSWFLAGIVSWGESCAAPNRPGVYTLISAYQSWIHQNAPEVKFGVTTFTVNGCETLIGIVHVLLPLLLLVLLNAF